jgi:hypothetical protein
VDTSDIAARARQARRQSGLHWIIAADPNNRCCAGRGAGRPRDSGATRDDHLGLPADDRASEIGIALGSPFAGIPLDREVLALDIAQPAQLLEKRQPQAVSLADASDGT